MKRIITKNFLNKIGILVIVAGSLSLPVSGQTNSQKFEDFNRANNQALNAPSGSNTQTWLETESAAHNFRVRIENNMLVLGSHNNATPAAGTSAVEQASLNLTNQFATVYNQAAANLTWHFNLRQSRPNPSGFGTGFYGAAYILGATEANFTSPAASGYAVLIGNANTPDPVKLVRFTGGLNANSNITTILTSSEENTTAYYSVKVTFNPCSKEWSLQVRNDGTTAFADPVTVNTPAVFAKDQVFTNTNLPFIGAAFSHGTADEKAYFDNLYLPTSGVASLASYTWTGAVSTNFEEPDNWNPARTCNRQTDVLIFNSGKAVTISNVSSQELGKIEIAANTTVSLRSKAGGTQTLSITGGAGEDLTIGSNAALVVDSNDALELILKPGTTGQVFGSIVFQNTEANLGRAHRIMVADASGLVFENKSQFVARNLNGEAFGNSGNGNTVIFRSGSVYVSRDGASPFGLPSPASKVVFETGSLYRHEQVGTAPKFDGRVYADFELNVTNALAIIFGTSAPTPSRIDNFTISSGTMNITLASGINPLPLHIKGNLQVAPAAALNFNPTAAQNTSLISFNGTAKQTISGAVNFGKFTNLEVNNAAGLHFNANFTVHGGLQLTNGLVTLAPNTALTFADNATVSGANANSYVTGTVFKTGDDAFTFPIGKSGFYAPLSISAPSNVTDRFVAEYFFSDPTSLFGNSKTDSLTLVSNKEFWDLERIAGNSEVQVSLSYDPARSALSAAPQDLRIAHFSNNSSWKNEGLTNLAVQQNLAVYGTRSAQSSFSPFTFGAVGVNGTLPVELLDFTAETNIGGVELNWTTASEKNNDRFEIERSRDGRTFEKIGETKGKGNSQVSTRYTFADKKSINGSAYYRLKQIDLDGTFTYSKIVTVTAAAIKPVIRLYPNPVQDVLTVVMPANEENTQLQILDLTGKVLKNSPVKKGEKEVSLNTADLKAGTYLLITGNGQPAMKFIKVN